MKELSVLILSTDITLSRLLLPIFFTFSKHDHGILSLNKWESVNYHILELSSSSRTKIIRVIRLFPQFTSSILMRGDAAVYIPTADSWQYTAKQLTETLQDLLCIQERSCQHKKKNQGHSSSKINFYWLFNSCKLKTIYLS